MLFYNSTINKLYLEEAKKNEIYIGDINEDNFTILNSNVVSFDGSKLVTGYNLPDWIFHGRNIMFTFTFEEDEIHYYRRVKSIFSDDITGDFWFSIDKKIIKPEDYILTKISGVQNKNTSGEMILDAMGNKISSVTDLNSQKIIACTDINTEDNKGVLIFDRYIQKLSGTFSLFSATDNTKIKGNNSFLLNELKKGDYIYVGSEYHRIKKVVDNITAFVENPILHDFVQKPIMVTSNPTTDMYSIIYDKYNTVENTGIENHQNTFSIRPNREINYLFNVSEEDGEFNGQKITLPNFQTGDKIYKIWINGELLLPTDYIQNDKNIFLRDDKKIRGTYNYYVYIKYNDNTKNGINGNYAVFNYYGYDTNFSTQFEYFNNLFLFPYHENLTEDMNNNYTELSEKFTNVNRRILKSTSNKISFDSKIGKKTGSTEVKHITDDISEILTNLYNFRLIKVVGDEFDKIIIYTNCQMITPPVEKTDLSVNSMSYNIDFKNKIVFKDRLFGEGDWGRFNPFGLKQISSTLNH